MTIYFDNSATTIPSQEVLHSMNETLEKYYGNPSSLHALGGDAEQVVLRCKQRIAELFSVGSDTILFTSGGTESNNLAIKGAALAYQHRGKHIITSQIEHPAVYDVCRYLEQQMGFCVTYLPVDHNGLVRLNQLEESIRDDTILVSIMHVNNELGSIQPIHQIGHLLKENPKILFHVDAVQGVGKAPLSIPDDFIDLLTISGHKIHAPKGTGLLFIRKGVHLEPLFHGGGQQQAIRPGTENVAAGVALAKALRLVRENEADVIPYFEQLKQEAIRGLQQIEGVHIHSPCDPQRFAPHIINFSIPGMKPEVIVHALEEKGIYISTKSACSSKNDEPSRVLTAIGVNEENAHASLRISFSKDNTMDEVHYFNQVAAEMIPHYQQIMKARIVT